MLNRKSVLAAAPIVDEFLKRGHIVVPIPGTPASAVCATMAPGDIPPDDIDGLIQLSAENIVEIDVVAEPLPESGDDIAQGSRQVHLHDEAMQSAVASMAEKINHAKQEARGTILPQCRELYVQLQKRVDDLIYAPKLVPTVVMSYYPDFYTSEFFIAQMTGINLESFIDADRSYRPHPELAVIPGDYLRNALVTGNTDIDQLVAETAAGVTDAALEDIYNHYFRGSSLMVLKEEFLLQDEQGVGFIGGREAAAAALFCWVWAQTLYEDVQEGNKLSLDNYQATMNFAKRTAQNGMARIYRDRMLKIQEGELVLAAPSVYQMSRAEDASELHIVVNADTYLDYLRNGGSPEALTGAVLMEQRRPSKEALLSNTDVLMRQYNEFVELKASQQSANRIRAYGLALKGVFSDLVIPLVDESSQEPVKMTVGQIVENINDADIANMQQFLRRMYVNAVVQEGAQTINRLIDEIDAEMRGNPELTVFEAATKAQVNLLSDFVAQQFYLLEA